MRYLAALAIGLLYSVATAGAQTAQPTSPEAAKPGMVCLYPEDIASTRTVDPQTILFYMRDKKIWKNTLKAPCPDLMFDGFAYEVRGGNICSNLQAIRVLRSGEVCLLGTFTPYTPPPGAH